MSKNYTETVVRSMAAHPFIWAAAVCLLLNPLCYGAVGNIPTNVLPLLTLALIGAAAIFLLKKYRAKKLNALAYTSIMAALVMGLFLLINLYNRSEHKAEWFFLGGLGLLTLLYCKADRKSFGEQLNALFIIAAGSMLKFYYVLDTSVYTRQHDIGEFGIVSGHAGYINYIINNRHLPDFDARNTWQFCHPPLHHMLSAVWIWVNESVFKVDYDRSRESLQMLTLFYSLCIMILAYKLLRKFGLKDTALYIPLAIINFHPAFVILSGSINNDILSIALVMGAVVCTIDWYRKPTMQNILKIALCIGYGMMAKLSAALVAPAVAAIFLTVLIKSSQPKTAQISTGKLIGQFGAFLAICVPFGLWYPLRNYIIFKIPVMYVHKLDNSLLQYIGDQSFGSRITDFSPKQFRSVFVQWASRNEAGEIVGYNEYNPLVGLLKTSVFDECSDANAFSGMFITPVCTALFWVAAVIAAAAFVSMVIAAVTKGKDESRGDKLFLVLFYGTMLVNFYKLAKDYPFTCSMNFRYITPTVIIGALFLGLMVKRYGKLKIPFAALTAVFVGCASFVCLAF